MIVTGSRSRAGGWSAARRPRRSAGAMRADINVTPLVDVVLVLLIIFMVVTPMLSKGVNVDLPITRHHDKRGDDNRDIVVAITHTGEIYVGTERVMPANVGASVGAERRRHPEKTIFLKGDTRIGYGQAREVMEALHAAGIDQIQIGTEEARRP